MFESARSKLKARKGTFHVIGLDFMIDDAWKVHFIEANGYPGFTWSINFNTRGMVEDMYDLVQELHEAPGAFRLMRSGDRYGSWTVVHSDVELGDMDVSYNPCEEFRDSIALFTPLKEANKIAAKLASDVQELFDDDSAYPKRVPGWQSLGGEKGENGRCGWAWRPHS